jgi:hypothetical protein
MQQQRTPNIIRLSQHRFNGIRKNTACQLMYHEDRTSTRFNIQNLRIKVHENSANNIEQGIVCLSDT